ncbi:tetratricopeptide repeat protein [Pseudomonas sp. TH31]|nr:sel1 repeat family protein [Pseudomonas sp. TH31]MBK5418542.1 sel1 repeat family protein [Pseudomonas sp. TH31]
MQLINFMMCGFLALIFSATVEAQLTQQQKEAKIKGLELYNQYKAISATPFLQIAANADDKESQYYLGEAIRKNKRYMTEDAQKWYEAAANQNNIYAMIQLGRSGNDLCTAMDNCPKSKNTPAQWLKSALDLTAPAAEHGNPEAMYLMYELTLKQEWLEKSANSGYALAQYWMATGTRQGDGFFLPWKRNEAVGNWLKLSAEGGYPPAMMEYAAFIFEDKGDLAVARHWISEAANAGYQSGISSYGAYLAHSPSLYDFPLDLVKGYALTSLLKDLDGGGDVQVYVNETLPEIASKMKPEQISEATEFAKKWKATHPPLSFFPEKLSR